MCTPPRRRSASCTRHAQWRAVAGQAAVASCRSRAAAAPLTGQNPPSVLNPTDRLLRACPIPTTAQEELVEAVRGGVEEALLGAAGAAGTRTYTQARGAARRRPSAVQQGCRQEARRCSGRAATMPACIRGWSGSTARMLLTLSRLHARVALRRRCCQARRWWRSARRSRRRRRTTDQTSWSARVRPAEHPSSVILASCEQQQGEAPPPCGFLACQTAQRDRCRRCCPVQTPRPRRCTPSWEQARERRPPPSSSSSSSSSSSMTVAEG